MQKLHEGKILNDTTFELYEYNSMGVVVKQKYRGAWLLVDNGCLAHPTTVPPIKTTTSKSEIRFSAWLESLRKDVECTFGILKGRWRILKTGVRLHGVIAADKVFTTCCALHNWLLEVDGLDARWEEGVRSDWDVGACDEEDMIPDAVARLRHPVKQRNYDLSGMGAGSDGYTEHENSCDPAPDRNNHSTTEEHCRGARDHGGDTFVTRVQVVRNLSLRDFGSRLVTHFNIAFNQNEIIWPRRTGTGQPAGRTI